MVVLLIFCARSPFKNKEGLNLFQKNIWKYVVFIFFALSIVTSCGRRSDVLKKPDGEGVYPKQYPKKIT